MDKIFIDANIFLEIHLNDKNKESCEKLINEVIEGKYQAYTSDFILYSVIIQIERSLKSAEKVRNFIIPINSITNLEIIRPSLGIVKKAISFIEKYRLDFDDALVVACMIKKEIKKLVSFDLDFDKVKEIQRITP